MVTAEHLLKNQMGKLTTQNKIMAEMEINTKAIRALEVRSRRPRVSGRTAREKGQ